MIMIRALLCFDSGLVVIMIRALHVCFDLVMMWLIVSGLVVIMILAQLLLNVLAGLRFRYCCFVCLRGFGCEWCSVCKCAVRSCLSLRRLPLLLSLLFVSARRASLPSSCSHVVA